MPSAQRRAAAIAVGSAPRSAARASTTVPFSLTSTSSTTLVALAPRGVSSVPGERRIGGCSAGSDSVAGAAAGTESGAGTGGGSSPSGAAGEMRADAGVVRSSHTLAAVVESTGRRPPREVSARTETGAGGAADRGAARPQPDDTHAASVSHAATRGARKRPNRRRARVLRGLRAGKTWASIRRGPSPSGGPDQEAVLERARTSLGGPARPVRGSPAALLLGPFLSPRVHRARSGR